MGYDHIRVTESGNEIRRNFARVCEQIDAAARRAGRDAREVTLVGVSKTHPPESVVEALQAGVLAFGENRVQEAAAKIPAVAERLAGSGQVLAPRWHLVGHLQTNKAKQAVELFDTVDSVDSVRLAEALDRAVAARERGPLPVLLEVYFGDDPGRPGLRPADVPEAVERIAALEGLAVQGLMTVAPLGWDEDATRGAFRQLRELQEQLRTRFPRVHWQHLSMGMTEDFVPAIEEGSTIVRIGRAIFGSRE